MKIEQVPIDTVPIAEHRRPLDSTVVDNLAESMRAVGLLQPIILHNRDDGAIDLVAGRHRLAAAKNLEWACIDAIFITGASIDLRLSEIAENLHRAELTVQQRAEQIAEWTDLIEQKAQLQATTTSEEKPAQVAQVSSNKGGRGKKGGSSKAARDLGLDRDEVRRAQKIAGMAPEAKEAAKAAGLDDNQSALLEVAGAQPSQQVAKVAQIKARDAKRAKKNRLTQVERQRLADDAEQVAEQAKSRAQKLISKFGLPTVKEITEAVQDPHVYIALLDLFLADTGTDDTAASAEAMKSRHAALDDAPKLEGAVEANNDLKQFPADGSIPDFLDRRTRATNPDGETWASSNAGR